ncbi:sigma-E processing peptidase SpoIIGA [Cellulosilyticum sp. I15G10I2]|uniref:sigma-E processing peptidase SpoIIGA n=1 Tax=Cellulosilyticum sp. I15G10I2 TaxID=1892843 RepID=UPI00085BC255|nr:sigma-E processing peptidase SpoIIGA [Cellulosilyticum sp. I15G10I2]
MYVVYIDILFLINIVMDMMVFYTATMILNKSIGKVRIFIASIIAALIYCMLVCVPILQSIPYVLYALFVPTLSILYLYRPRHLKEFAKIYLVCMGVACTIGGATFTTWFMVKDKTPIHTISIFWLIIIALGITLIIYISFNKIRKRMILPLFEYDIKIKNTDKEVWIKSILDTGNCLYTPIGHKPVIVVTYDALKELFTDKQILVLSKYKNNVLELAYSSDFMPSYIIPFNSVGCKLGILLGIEVDQVNIYKNHFKKSVDKCIVAISFNNIFNDKSYNALLHPDFILN